MAQFRAKTLDLSCYVNIKVIRDHTKRYVQGSNTDSSTKVVLTSSRKVFEQYETERYARPYRMFDRMNVAAVLRFMCRQALRYIIRNTTLPQRTRAQAQLQLSQMHAYTRLTQVNNRCILGGKSRGVFSDFRMARVRLLCG